MRQSSSPSVVTEVTLSEGEPNADIDWAAKGMVNPPKNSGGSCASWAFQTTPQLETVFLQKGVNVSLSEQQLIDCSGAYGNQGCNGGWVLNGLAYVRAVGITTEAAYPYVGKSQTCKVQGGPYHITSISSATTCTGIQNGLLNTTIAVVVDATNWSSYKSGIFNNCTVHPTLNHGVLLVGSSSTFWKVQSGWPTSWGEDGFMRIAYGNTCGICSSGVWSN
jgi:C1A family cysteine protease